nr:uncharacterized protein LOC133618800 isoform X5 [Nerophis lumbriciformis]
MRPLPSYVRWSAPGSVIGTPVSYRDPCVSSNQLSPSIRARSRTLPGMILTCHGGVAFYCVDCSPRMQTELRRQGAGPQHELSAARKHPQMKRTQWAEQIPRVPTDTILALSASRFQVTLNSNP